MFTAFVSGQTVRTKRSRSNATRCLETTGGGRSAASSSDDPEDNRHRLGRCNREREQGAEGLVALRAVVCTVRFQQRPDAAAKLAEFKALPYKDDAIKKFIADEKLATMVGENAPAADAIARCAYAINNLAS
jgi:hypothetical protein